MNKVLNAVKDDPTDVRFGLLKNVRWRSLAIVLPFLVVFIAVSVGSPSFLTPINLLNILDQQSSILIIAAAGTIVLITGGIDLSVGATFGLAAVVSGTVALTNGPALGLISGLVVGGIVGLVNGVVSTILKINALIPIALLSALVAVQSFTSGKSLVIDQRLAGLAVAVIALILRAPFALVVVSAAATSAGLYHLQ
jgi:ribose/xylose/arabinose/galactoside ABC-type transport system permease subunit